VGAYSSPSAAAERDPLSLDEASSELVSSTVLVFHFFRGGGEPPAEGSQLSLQRLMVLMERSSSRLKRDSGGGLRPPCFAAPRSSKASLYHAAFLSSARFWLLADSCEVVRTPESGSHVHKPVSEIIVEQHERLNNSIRKVLGRPWLRRTWPM
jgi:hypothetical protein